MGSTILEAFLVTFALDSKPFKSGADEVEGISKRTRDQVKKTFGEIEGQGKNLGQAIRTVSNEAVGLFLAFSGASSFTSFVAQMMTGAASADRLGQTLGMATGKVMAWRQAMAGIGGSEGSADAALSMMERMVQSYRLTGTTGADADLLGLGINRGDLDKLSPDQLLTKIAGARGRMDGPEFAARLGRIGMPQDMTNFLMQGQATVQKQISAFEANTTQMDQAAKSMEGLQTALANLSSDLKASLVPEITKLVEGLDKLLNMLPAGFFQDPIRTTGGNLWDHVANTLDDHGHKGAGKWIRENMGAGGYGQFRDAVTGGWDDQPMNARKGGSRANRNNNPGNIIDSPFARRQPGYAGTDGKFARFFTPDAGWAAQEKLLGNYMGGGRKTIASIIAKWAPRSENNVERYMRAVEQTMHMSRYAQLGTGQVHALMAAMAKQEGYKGPSHIHIAKVDVHTQARDAHGIARDLHGALRNRITQTDGGMAP